MQGLCMKFVPKFFGKVDDYGKLTLDAPQTYEDYLRGLKGVVEVLVYPWRRKRSLKQNSLYWAFINLIAEETGEDEDSLHELFKKKFCPKEVSTVLGEEVEYYQSTTKLSKQEFTQYLDRISAFSGIPIPNLKEVEII